VLQAVTSKFELVAGPKFPIVIGALSDDQ